MIDISAYGPKLATDKSLAPHDLHWAEAPDWDERLKVVRFEDEVIQ